MKRLAIFLDGTWNTLNNNTNVWRLRSHGRDRRSARLLQPRRRYAARGVTGWGIDDEIIEAYTWLIQNFDDGDEIFIFGFSRGAYTARSLSGLICKCGVLKLGAPLSIEQLYARYRIYDAPTIRSLQGKPLPNGASIEEQWLTSSRAPRRSGSSAYGTRSARSGSRWRARPVGSASTASSTASAPRQRVRLPCARARRTPQELRADLLEQD
jgi:uncharacterized protein (DUF2235 family)